MIDPQEDARMWKEFEEQQRRMEVKRLVVDKKFTDKEIEEIRKLTEAFCGVGEIRVCEPTVTHLKVKKGIPTVIEYQGRRYILDANHRK